MVHFTSQQLAQSDPPGDHVETLVVGAGMAGLYATWRLLDNDSNADVMIFERSNRTGGRLDSDLVHFGREKSDDAATDGEVVKEEEGGMRFTFDLMDDLMSLFLLFDLTDEIVPFPMSGSGTNRLCFRGRSFTVEESKADDYAIWSELYNLAPAERHINPGSIIDTIFNRILAANPKFTQRPKLRTPEFWQDFRLQCTWNDVALVDWTLWNLCIDMGYSAECIRMMYGLAGFNGTFLSRMNAGEAFQLLEDFPANPDFFTLENGFSTLPNAMVSSIGGERIHLNTTVESIEDRTADGYVVRYRTKDATGAETVGRVTASSVILALPRMPLERLYLASPVLNSRPESAALWDTLQTTTDQALLKINLYYDQAWWGTNLSGQESVGYGPNFTDLPLGSVYPFYAIDEEAFAALEYRQALAARGEPIPAALTSKLDKIDTKKYNAPAALTIYCDYLNINFWKALQENGPLFDSAKQREYSGHVPQTLFPASQEVVAAATEFFRQLFDTTYVPQPTLTSARIWDGSALSSVPPSQAFDFAVHQWGLHARDDVVINDLISPMENLYTCGEAFSDYQGWVEGALRSTDLVLDCAFGLRPVSEVYTADHGTTPSDAVKQKHAARSAESIRKYIDPDFSGDGVPSNGRPAINHSVTYSYFDVV